MSGGTPVPFEIRPVRAVAGEDVDVPRAERERIDVARYVARAGQVDRQSLLQRDRYAAGDVDVVRDRQHRVLDRHPYQRRPVGEVEFGMRPRLDGELAVFHLREIDRGCECAVAAAVELDAVSGRLYREHVRAADVEPDQLDVPGARHERVVAAEACRRLEQRQRERDFLQQQSGGVVADVAHLVVVDNPVVVTVQEIRSVADEDVDIVESEGHDVDRANGRVARGWTFRHDRRHVHAGQLAEREAAVDLQEVHDFDQYGAGHDEVNASVDLQIRQRQPFGVLAAPSSRAYPAVWRCCRCQPPD